MKFPKSIRSSCLCGLLALAGFVLCPVDVLACSCAEPGPPKAELERAAAVFVGKVTKLEQNVERHQLTVTFEVRKAWKGAKEKKLTLTTPLDGAACGFSFGDEPGGEYLVYANADPDNPGSLETNICTRTKALAEADSDLKELGAPAKG